MTTTQLFTTWPTQSRSQRQYTYGSSKLMQHYTKNVSALKGATTSQSMIQTSTSVTKGMVHCCPKCRLGLIRFTVPLEFKKLKHNALAEKVCNWYQNNVARVRQLLFINAPLRLFNLFLEVLRYVV